MSKEVDLTTHALPLSGTAWRFLLNAEKGVYPVWAKRKVRNNMVWWPSLLVHKQLYPNACKGSDAGDAVVVAYCGSRLRMCKMTDQWGFVPLFSCMGPVLRVRMHEALTYAYANSGTMSSQR